MTLEEYGLPTAASLRTSLDSQLSNLSKPFPNKKYGVILADPPWHFRLWSPGGSRTGRTAESHYPVMRLADLKALPVSTIAAPDCALFLWACMPLLPDALELIEAWGFTHKTTAFVWVKRTTTGTSWHYGLGYWTRANAEIVLLATRGKPKRIEKGVAQLVIAPAGEHSAKPHEVRTRIERLMGDVPRIELFARSGAPGWDSWGLEAGTRPTQLALDVTS